MSRWRGHDQLGSDYDRFCLFLQQRKDLVNCDFLDLSVKSSQSGMQLVEAGGTDEEGADSLLLDGKFLEVSTDGGQLSLSDGAEFSDDRGWLFGEKVQKLL